MAPRMEIVAMSLPGAATLPSLAWMLYGPRLPGDHCIIFTRQAGKEWVFVPCKAPLVMVKK